MNHLKLGSKIGLIIAIQLIIMLFLILINFIELNTLQEKLTHALQITAPKGVAINRVRLNMLDTIRLLDLGVLSENEKDTELAIKQSNEALELTLDMKKKVNEFVAKDGTPEEKAILEEWNPLIAAFIKSHKEISELILANTNGKATQILDTSLNPKFNQLRDMLGTLGLQQDREFSKAETEKNPARMQSLHRRSLQLSQTVTNLQEMVRLLQAANYAGVDQKNALESQRKSLTKDIETVIRELEASSDDRNGLDQQVVNRIRTSFTELKELADKLEILTRRGTDQRAVKIIVEEATPTNEKLYKTIIRYRDYYNKRLEEEKKEAEDGHRSARWFTILSAILGTGLSLLLSYLVTRSITRPLAQAADQAKSMATGLAEVSQQLLTRSQDIANQASTVATATEQMAMNISTMAAASEEMSMNVASISSASGEMSVNVGTISSAAEETSNNVTNVSSSIQAMSQSFRDISRIVGNGSAVASQAMNLANNATNSMKALDHNAGEINKVTEMIKMIALQTNLLALNATIEATSAGDAGKGFAVVASEIKELANQSGRAAEDIARKIETMQISTREAVSVIQNVTSIIRDINESVEQVSLSVDQQTENAGTISRNISEASKGVGDIARSISEVAKGATDMSRNASDAASGATDMSRNSSEAANAGKAISSTIQNLDQAAGSNTKSAGLVNSAAQDLTQIADELKRLI